MADPNQTPQTTEGDFGAEEGVSVPTSIGHGRLSVEENVPGNQAPNPEPKDTDPSGLVP